MPTPTQIQKGLAATTLLTSLISVSLDREKYPAQAAALFGFMLLMGGMILEIRRLVALREQAQQSRAAAINELKADLPVRQTILGLTPVMLWAMIQLVRIEPMLALAISIAVGVMSLISLRYDNKFINQLEQGGIPSLAFSAG